MDFETVLCSQTNNINTAFFEPFEQVLKTPLDFYKCAETLPNYQCDNCTYNTPWRVSLIKHFFKECNKKIIFKCDYCPYKSEFRMKLAIHKKKHEVSFSDEKKSYKFNVKFVENVKYYECIYCSYQTPYTTKLCVHIIHKHTPDEEIDWFECDQCSYKGKTSYSLQQHKARHEKGAKFECQLCPYKTRDKQSLNFHNLARHATEATTWYNCDQCNFKTPIINKLKVHKSSRHETVKKFKCSYCAFATQRIYYLKEHNLLKHTPDDEAIWYQCDKCKFKTKLSRTLNRHKAIHDPDNYEKFQCHNCAYKTHDKQHLKRHMIYKHTPDEAINWLHCDQCAFKAKFASGLKQHKQTHFNSSGTI